MSGSHDQLCPSKISKDLAWRVVFKHYLEDMANEDISVLLMVPEKSVRRVLRLYEETGDVKRSSHHCGDYLRHFVEFIKKNPGLGNKEYSEELYDISGIYIQPKTMERYLPKTGQRPTSSQRKRVASVNPAREVFNGNEIAKFVKFVGSLPLSMLLFVDVSLFSFKTTRREGQAPDQYGQNSLIAGLDETGIVGRYVVENQFTTDLLNLAVAAEIIRHVGSFAHKQPRSVVILGPLCPYDGETVSLIRRAGGVVLFLPKAPHFNPLEKAFNQMRGWLVSNSDYSMGHPKAAILDASASINAGNALDCMLSCGY